MKQSYSKILFDKISLKIRCCILKISKSWTKQVNLCAPRLLLLLFFFFEITIEFCVRYILTIFEFLKCSYFVGKF